MGAAALARAEGRDALADWQRAAPGRSVCCRLVAPDGGLHDLSAHDAAGDMPAAGLRHLPLVMAWACARGDGPVSRFSTIRADALPRFAGPNASDALPGELALDDDALAGLALLSDDRPAAAALYDRLGRRAINRVLLSCACSTRIQVAAPGDAAADDRLTAADAANLLSTLVLEPAYRRLRARVLASAPAPMDPAGVRRPGLLLGRPVGPEPGPIACAGAAETTAGVLVWALLSSDDPDPRGAWRAATLRVSTELGSSLF